MALKYRNLAALLSHAGLMSGDARYPWAKPGAEKYPTAARLADAGCTYDDLIAAGLQLQGCSYAHYSGAADKDAFCERYQREHGGAGRGFKKPDSRVSVESSPAGLRPHASIPGTAKTSHVATWYARIQDATATAMRMGRGDDIVEAIPFVYSPAGDAVVGDATAPEPVKAKVRNHAGRTAPPDLSTPDSVLAAVRVARDGVVAHAREIVRFLTDYTDAPESFAELRATIAEGPAWLTRIDSLTASDFDRNAIRPGVEVTLAATARVQYSALLSALSKTLGTLAETFIVTEVTPAGVKVTFSGERGSRTGTLPAVAFVRVAREAPRAPTGKAVGATVYYIDQETFAPVEAVIVDIDAAAGTALVATADTPDGVMIALDELLTTRPDYTLDA